MYKLPMFGCTDSSQVLAEIQSAVKSFPKAYIRLVAFDADKQVQGKRRRERERRESEERRARGGRFHLSALPSLTHSPSHHPSPFLTVAGMLVHRPTYDDCCKPEERSV